MAEAAQTLVRLDPGTAERLALRIATLVADRLEHRAPAARQQPPELLTATQVSQWWGLHRSWVYQHADALGAIRIGTGQRPRLRFDPEQVACRLARPPHPKDPGQPISMKSTQSPSIADKS